MSVLPVSIIAPRVRAFFAPVDRTNLIPMPFDPAVQGRFALNAPPAGWLNAGPITGFERTSVSEMLPLRSGAPAVLKTQARASVGAEVQLRFTCWSKLAMALSSATEQMNLLLPVSGSAGPSGGVGQPAEVLQAGSTATSLQLQAGSQVTSGSIVAVDRDYTGQTGFVGAAAAAAFVSSAQAVNNDANYLRRVTLNVARVASVLNGVATLVQPLPAGAPDVAMKLSVVAGFVDREGGSLVPEWSALFVVEGVQGDRVLFHYPRLQPCTGAREEHAVFAPGLERWMPAARFEALPVTDPNDGGTAVCFRSYLPAPGRSV